MGHGATGQHALSEISNSDTFGNTLRYIAASNIPTWCTLVAGALTFGMTTFFSAIGVGLYLGISIAVSLDAFRASEVVAATWIYSPLEFSGMFLAGVAGFLPIAKMVAEPHRGQEGFVARWRRAIRASSRFVIGSFLLVAFGVVVEALVIVSR